MKNLKKEIKKSLRNDLLKKHKQNYNHWEKELYIFLKFIFKNDKMVYINPITKNIASIDKVNSSRSKNLDCKCQVSKNNMETIFKKLKKLMFNINFYHHNKK